MSESQKTTYSPIAAEKSDQIDTAIEHICFLADTNRLFDHALGLYDLELALLIAQQSQRVSRVNALNDHD